MKHETVDLLSFIGVGWVVGGVVLGGAGEIDTPRIEQAAAWCVHT